MIPKWAVAVLCCIAALAGFYLSLSLRADFTTLSGKSLRWSELEGQYVIVNYFAEWCAPCLKEIPELNGFSQYADRQSNVSLLAVNFDNLPEAQLRELISKYDIQFEMINGLPQQAPFSMPKALPATYIIGPDGELIKQLNGEQSEKALINIIETLSKL